MSELALQHERWSEARERLWARGTPPAIVRRVLFAPKPEPKIVKAPDRARRLFKGLIVEVDALGNDLMPPDTFMPKWKQIAVQVAAKHGVTLFDLQSARRDARAVRARHDLMYRCRMETSMSLPQIGKRLGGRDHTTILHGIRTHARRNDLPLPNDLGWAKYRGPRKQAEMEAANG